MYYSQCAKICICEVSPLDTDSSIGVGNNFSGSGYFRRLLSFYCPGQGDLASHFPVQLTFDIISAWLLETGVQA